MGWLWCAFAGGAACLVTPLLVLICSSLRYLSDITLLMAGLTALSFWWGLDFFHNRPRQRTALILLSILARLVVVFNTGAMRFAAVQPELYARIADFLRSLR